MFFLCLWQGLIKCGLHYWQWLLMYCLPQFPDNILLLLFRQYLQTEWQKTFLSIRFERQRFYSKVVRVLDNLLPNLLHLFSYRCCKFLFRWCCMWFLNLVFRHIVWLAPHLRQRLTHRFWLLQLLV